MNDKNQRELIILRSKISTFETQIEILQQQLMDERQQKEVLKDEIELVKEKLETKSYENEEARQYIVMLEKQDHGAKQQKLRADAFEDALKERSNQSFKLLQQVKSLEIEKEKLIEALVLEKSKDCVKEAEAKVERAIMERTTEIFNHTRTRDMLREKTMESDKLKDRLSVLERYCAKNLTYWQRLQIFLKF